MINSIGRYFGISANVKHAKGHSPRKVEFDGKRAFDFAFECVKHGRKITVYGVMNSDKSAHAEERSKQIYKVLEKYIDTHNAEKITEEKLAKVVKKQLHHRSDLLKITYDIHKK